MYHKELLIELLQSFQLGLQSHYIDFQALMTGQLEQSHQLGFPKPAWP